MKSKTGWIRQELVWEDNSITNPNGNNESGFNGIPGGYRHCNYFSHGGAYGMWWTSSKSNWRHNRNKEYTESFS